MSKSDLHEEAGLADLGLDSLARIEFGIELKDQFGIAVPELLLSATATVGDVLRYLREQQ